MTPNSPNKISLVSTLPFEKFTQIASLSPAPPHPSPLPAGEREGVRRFHSFIMLSNILAEAGPDPSSGEPPEFAEEPLLSALAFESEEGDSLRRDWKQKNNG
jgi:hypothetical protein